MIWSICGSVNESEKKKVDVYIRKLESVFPIKDTVYHYYVDNNYGKFKHWEEKLSIHFWKYHTGCVIKKQYYTHEHVVTKKMIGFCFQNTIFQNDYSDDRHCSLQLSNTVVP